MSNFGTAACGQLQRWRPAGGSACVPGHSLHGEVRLRWALRFDAAAAREAEARRQRAAQLVGGASLLYVCPGARRCLHRDGDGVETGKWKGQCPQRVSPSKVMDGAECRRVNRNRQVQIGPGTF